MIGAGFTGTTLAVLLDRSGMLGEGLAYATTNDRHQLNVPAGKMVRPPIKAGLVRPGPLSPGLEVDDGFRPIDADGVASSRLFTVGPPLRGVLWETTAVPDIRRQCAALAQQLMSSP